VDEVSGRHAAGSVLDAPPVPPLAPAPSDAPDGSAADDTRRVRARLLAEAGDAVLARVADLVSMAVGHLAATDLPATVRPVARFTPAKRARLGSGPMLAALTGQDGFAEQVVTWWRENRPGDWSVDADRSGTEAAPDRGVEGPSDPLQAAAVALLEGRDEGTVLVREASEREEVTRVRVELDAVRTRSERLTAELAQAVAERDEAREATRMIPVDHGEEVVKLRARLREQGVRVRRAEDAAAEATGRLEAGHADVLSELVELRRERDRHRAAAHAAETHARRLALELDAARRSSHDSRAADDLRLALLLDTLSGAAAGVRRELGIRGIDPQASRPADVAVPGAVPVVGGPAPDPAALDRLLALPEVHVLIDGYNVTKTAWAELPLASQRERLVGAMAPLSKRTGAETTVVFDGAGVVGVPTPSVRGVRVLFSEPGTIADDLIRRLVSAEPQGRPLVVVTSDRAIVESVRRQGAHPVASAVLLERLARI